MPPKKGEPGYEEYRRAYNARRDKRKQDPEYAARYATRNKARHDAKRRQAQQLEIPYDEDQ